MNALLRAQGHSVINTDSVGGLSEAVDIQFSHALEHLLNQWRTVGLPDNGWRSPYTTEASVGKIVQWTNHLTAPSL
jgi:hypothetical protein